MLLYLFATTVIQVNSSINEICFISFLYVSYDFFGVFLSKPSQITLNFFELNMYVLTRVAKTRQLSYNPQLQHF